MSAAVKGLVHFPGRGPPGLLWIKVHSAENVCCPLRPLSQCAWAVQVCTAVSRFRRRLQPSVQPSSAAEGEESDESEQAPKDNTKGKSSAVPATSSPAWTDAEFVLDVRPHGAVDVCVVDTESFAKDVAGFAKITLRGLRAGEQSDISVPLVAPVAWHKHFRRLRGDPSAVYPPATLHVSLTYLPPEGSPALRTQLHNTRAAVLASVAERRRRVGARVHAVTGLIHVALNDAVPTLRTGDIVLLHGRERISRAIELATASYFSHVALIVRSPSPATRAAYNLAQYDATAARLGVRTSQETDDVYVFESDTETFDKRAGGGVQLVPLRAWLTDYHKTCGPEFAAVVRRLALLPAPAGLGVQTDFPGLQGVLDTFAGRPYAQNYEELLRSLKGLNLSEDLGSVFCSQLVAIAYKAMGLLPQDTLANNVLPKHFAAQTVTLEHGASLEPAFRLVWSSDP